MYSEDRSVSAHICTRNRAGALAKTLAALGRVALEGVQAFELVVVDNGSTDNTRQVVTDFAKAAPFPVRYVLEPIPGAAHARNRALRESTGAIIMFTDDDCYVAADWVQVAVRFFSEGTLRIVGGRVELYNLANLAVSFKTVTEREAMTSVSQLFCFLLTANAAFGRSVIDLVGQFDVRLGPGSRFHAAEDTDFVYRAFLAGVPITYEPSMVVHHDHGRSGQASFFKLQRGYSEAIGAMVIKSVLSGRTDLLKPTYWDVCSEVRRWRARPSEWRALAAKIGILTGAVRFALFASWKNAL